MHASWILVLAGVVVVIAAAAIWVRHRRWRVRMERRLAWSESSVLSLEQQLQAAGQQMQLLTQTVKDRLEERPGSRDLLERQGAMQRVMARASGMQRTESKWPDTLPLGAAGTGFAKTSPGALTSKRSPADFE